MTPQDEFDADFWINFDEDEAYIFGGPIHSEEAWSGPVQFDNHAYDHMALISEEQLANLKANLACMDKFIAMVVAERTRLEAEIAEREPQERRQRGFPVRKKA